MSHFRTTAKESDGRLILESFSRHGVPVSPTDERCQHLIWEVAVWALGGKTRLQDTGDRKKGRPNTRTPVERIAALSDQLIDALIDAEDLANSLDRPDRLNVCDRFFTVWGLSIDDATVESVAGVLFGLKDMALFALSPTVSGNRPVRGTPPHRPYHKLVQALHEVYRRSTGREGITVGVYQDGRPIGPFVQIVAESQEILPQKLRAVSMETVGKRVLAALNPKMQRPVDLLGV